MTDLAERENLAERESRVDYKGYRAVADELSPAFRETGIVDSGGYDRAMRDPRTIKLGVAGDVELPLVTPIEYIAGYDISRSKTLADDPNVMVMSLPLAAISGQDVQIKQPSELEVAPTIIVETDHNETENVKQILPKLLDGLGQYGVQDFLDERIKNPEGKPASLSFYTSRFSAVSESGEFLPPTGNGFGEAYKELEIEGHPLTEHTKLIDAHQLRNNEELVDKLWDLCRERFQWLGEHHPVSMEDTKDFFLQVVHNEDTHTLVRYDDDGEPACIGFFMSGLDGCSWIKKSFRDQVRAEGEPIVYFYGIAGKDSANYGKDIMQTLARIGQKVGGTYQLAFESTNMSSRYIPRMVGAYVGRDTGVEMVEPPRKLAQIDYWYLSPTNG